MTDETSILQGIRRMLVVVAVLSLLGTAVSVWLGYSARQENCEITHRAFDGAFQQLGEELNAEQDRIDRFLSELDPILDRCA